MKRHSKAKLKGTVLFTVISVMSLLIIFLTSTLVLATSASNRSHKNYSVSQAEYTARAAIDSFSQAMARNVAVAKSVVDLNESNKLITPDVVINDAQMGQVGYYDNTGSWQDNKIKVEYVDDTYIYSENKWVAQQVLKIVATAKVGGEESTVTAYMRKKAPDEPKPLSIKGFQTLGSGGYTTTSGYVSGAISMGITDNPANKTYKLSNASEYNTDMFFVNGNLEVAGSDIRIDATKVASASVIMGDLSMQSSFLIDVNYPYATRDNANAGTPWEYELTQKDVPYIYVEGSIKPGAATNPFKVQTTGIDTATSKSTNAPYNIFCGHFDPDNGANGVSIEGDVYIMGNKTGAKGKSYFGRKNQNMTSLYAWTNSVLNKTNTQFYSNGGNLYSKDNLQVENAKIKGDVRVDGDFFLGDGVTIEGNLVVSGKIKKTDGSDFNFSAPSDKSMLVSSIKGNIYNGTTPVVLEGIDSGYHSRTNIYNEANNVKPGYVRVKNFEYPNVAVENNTIETIKYENQKYDNVQYQNYIFDTQVTGITEFINEKASEYEEIYVSVSGKWTPEFGYQEIVCGGQYDGVSIYDEKGNARNIEDFKHGNIYKIEERYFSYIPYINSISTSDDDKYISYPKSYQVTYPDGTTGNEYANGYTVYKADKNGQPTNIDAQGKLSIIYEVDKDGNPTDKETENPTVTYLVDKDGNPTDTQTENPFVIYEVDAYGNPTDVITDRDFLYVKTNPDGSSAYEIVNDAYTYYVPDSSGSAKYEIENGKKIYKSTSERSFRFKADINGMPTDVLLTNEEDKDKEYTYYDSTGAEVINEAEAISSNPYYTKWYKPSEVTPDEVSYYNVDPDAPPAEASPIFDDDGNYTPQYQSWIGSHAVPLSSVTKATQVFKYADYSGGAYPESMTREAIRGESEDGKYKIVSTLEDIKASIGCSESNSFDANAYYKEVPNVSIVGGKYQGFDYVTVSGNHTYDINRNTVIQTGETSNGPVVININPGGNTLWIVLDNCNFGNNKHRFIVGGNGIVNFLVKGTLSFDGSSPSGIFTKTVWDQISSGGKVIIREDDKLNINYYGAEGSHFDIRNQTVLCGIAKCPYSTINIGSQGCQKNFTYIDKTGKVIEFNNSNSIEARRKGANWIGNALFKEMGSSANNFRLLYTGSSDDGDDDISNATLDTTWTVMYYDVY